MDELEDMDDEPFQEKIQVK